MAKKTKAKKKSLGEDTDENQEYLMKVRDTEEYLREWLNPLESKIMTLQTILVWENPQHSAMLFLAVNILFW